MKKELSAMAMLLSLFAGMAHAPAFASAAEADIQSETEVDLALTNLDASEISDEELTEAEPSDLPEGEEDLEFTDDMKGLMILDVEGKGEVYYVDPVDGAKEYLADGNAAYSLLRRRALGINEENFAKLTQGTEKDEASVCATNELAARLKGRIVLRVEVRGEAWWILPTNCRAYYVGTHEAAYNLMKRFSLGMTKKNLARIPDTRRQKLKRAFRFSVYAYAQEHNVTLAEARIAVQSELADVRTCLKDRKVNLESSVETGFVRSHLQVCYAESDLPEIDRERLAEIKTDLREARALRLEARADLRDIRIDNLRARIEAEKNR